MNYEKHIIIILFLLLFSCSNKPKGNNAELLALSLLNPGNPDAISLVEIQVRDVGSYLGRCFDTFTGITAGSYYEMHYPDILRDLPHQKVRLSDKPCGRLGFSGGVSNRQDGLDLSFRSYSCGPVTSLCANSAIKEAGFQ